MTTLNFSFAGCGFLGIYHVGVASCLREHAPHLTVGKISGASAGAIAACCLITDVCLGQCTSYVLRVAAKARSRTLGPFHPSFNIMSILQEGLEEILPANAHETCNGRLHISMTRVRDKKNVVVSQFDSKEDLIQALLCSAFIPFWSGLIPPTYKGLRYVDGAFSNNLPTLNEETLTVSPFAGESDICPTDADSSSMFQVHIANTSVQISTGNVYRVTRILFPPHPEILSDMCKQGFDDCLKFLQKNNLISCTRHLSIRSSISTCNLQEELLTSDSEDSTDYDTFDNADDCTECKHRLHVASRDSVPAIVQSALQASIESFNQGLYNYIHQHKAYKLLSLLWAPLYLPIHMWYNFAKRFVVWVPYLPDELRWALEELLQCFGDILQHINRERHHYSARFTCQLAISELSEDSDSHIVTGHKETKTFKSQATLRNISMGFALGFDSDKQKSKTDKCLEELHNIRNHVLENDDIKRVTIDTDTHSLHGSVAHHAHTHKCNHGVQKCVRFANEENEDCHQLFDTFEHCLQVANDREAVLAYYYTDENDKVRVTEIFSLPDEDVTPDADNEQSNDLSWDNYGIMRLNSQNSMSPTVDDSISNLSVLLNRSESDCLDENTSKLLEQSFHMDTTCELLQQSLDIVNTSELLQQTFDMDSSKEELTIMEISLDS